MVEIDAGATPIENSDNTEVIPTPAEPEAVQSCKNLLRSGCYRIAVFMPGTEQIMFAGTLRVDPQLSTASNVYIISGDLYYNNYVNTTYPELGSSQEIPVYLRNQYHSYLKAAKIKIPAKVPVGKPCTITLEMEQFRYMHPEGDVSHNGTFVMSPNNNIIINLQKSGNNIYRGSWSGNETGDVIMEWVSDYFRKAVIRIDVVKGAAALPKSIIQNGVSVSLETTFATAGWEVQVHQSDDQLDLPEDIQKEKDQRQRDPDAPVPGWTNDRLHDLMDAVNPLSLDNSWGYHVLLVPFCWKSDANVPNYDLLGAMYDDRVPYRQGSAIFYSTLQLKGHDHDLAYLRIAAHEIGHGFNMPHPRYSDYDNSIMTESGWLVNNIDYPDGIYFGFNTEYRKHMVHRPDPFVRPGCMKHINSWLTAQDTPLSSAIELDDSSVNPNITLDVAGSKTPASAPFNKPLNEGEGS